MGTRTWGGNPGAALPVAVEVLRRGPVTRAEVGRRLGLSHASLSRLSNPLIERGILLETVEERDGNVGRPSKRLDVDASTHHFMGVKIREHEVIAAVTNLRGTVIASAHEEFRDTSPENVVEIVARIYLRFSASLKLSGIGIGIGGCVEKQRSILSASFLNWNDVPLAAMVEVATGAPTRVENDIVALCKYEDWFGSAKSDARFAVITLGIGTGFGVVVDGTELVNDDYGVGLVGHWPMDPNGPLCHEGHRGCAAALLNSDSISRYVSEALGRHVTFEEAIRLAEENQPAAIRIITDAARGLGVLIAAVCNLVLPDRIIIAGEGVSIATIGKRAMIERALSLRAKGTTLPEMTFSTGENVHWAQGAAVLMIQAFVLGEVSGPIGS